MKYDYNSLLIAAVMSLAVSQAVEGITTPAGKFFQGVLTGMSIACGALGLIPYARSSKKG